MSIKTDPKYGFKRIASPPDGDDLKSLYSDYFYDRDKPTYLTRVEQELDYWQAIFGLRLEMMKREIGRSGTILDIGAGGGFFLHSAAQKGWQVAGVEPSTEAVSYAADSFGLDLFCGFLQEFPPPPRPFDAIHTSLVLEHVADPEAFVRQTLALLKPGGVLWVEVPNDFNGLQLAITSQLDKPQWWVVPEHHLNYFNFDTLSALLCGQGAQEIARFATFPMEIFPLMGIDYIGDDQAGTQAHRMRMTFEKSLLQHQPEQLLALYGALAQAGVGRTCNLLVRKEGG